MHLLFNETFPACCFLTPRCNIDVCVFTSTSICGRAHRKTPIANPNGSGVFPHRWSCRICVFADEYISSRSADITEDKRAISPPGTVRRLISICVYGLVCGARVIILETIGVVHDFLLKFNLQDMQECIFFIM